MRCSICGKENNWLTPLGSDIVCNKCIVKHTIFKEMRFSDERKFSIVLKRRNFNNFDDLCKINDDMFQEIFEDKKNDEVNRPKIVNKKVAEDMEEPPIV
ncbi:MAG: hypothetical protein HZA83_02995 [Thaumarchaeota archaeon]|nr:hypothetical protein [Nitrososphaerota archaeon]